jgi:hypothetical protein
MRATLRAISNDEELKEVGQHSKSLLVAILSEIIDALFLALWVLIQFGLDRLIIRRFELSGWDAIVLTAFQVLFGLGTLVPPISNFYYDSRIIIKRSQQRWKKAEKALELTQ